MLQQDSERPTMCLPVRPVMFILVWMESVVPAGMATVAHDGSAAAFRKAGASSPPLAVRVHVPDALAESAGVAETERSPVASRMSCRSAPERMLVDHIV